MLEKLIERLISALEENTAALNGASGDSEQAEPKKPARGTGSSTGASPRKSAKKSPASKKTSTKTAEAGDDADEGPSRQQINDLVTKLAALDRKACGEVLKKHGKAPRVREVDEKHFPALAKGLKAALVKAKEAEAAKKAQESEAAEDGEGVDDDFDAIGEDLAEEVDESDEDDADLDFDDEDFD